MGARARAVWVRTQEAPIELTIAVTGAIIAAANLIGRGDQLAFYAIAFYLVMLVGGLSSLAGRLVDNLHAESVGLVLLLGGYTFSTMRRFAHADSVTDRNLAALTGVTFVVGLALRLYVVRKALRIRASAARRHRRQ